MVIYEQFLFKKEDRMKEDKKLNRKGIIYSIILFATAIVFYCIGLTVGRNKSSEISDDSQMFYATIQRIEDNNLLVQGLDVNDINFRSEFEFQIKEDTELIWRYTDIQLSDLQVGDRISIEFKGMILESYPGRIMDVTKIILLEDEK